MRRYLIVFFLIVILISKATAQVDNVSDALSRLDRAISRSEEEFTMLDSYYLGRTVAVNIIHHYSLYTEKPAVTEYLNFICRALAINSKAPQWYNGYFVTILNDPVPNAFSTPGGHIFISRGFIDLADSEDMLAAIIAHEMAHIQLEHGTKDIMQNRVINDLLQDRDRISGELSSQFQQQLFTETVSEMVKTLFSRGYSQTQEFDADFYAVELLASAGYSPGALLEVLAVLQRVQPNQTGGLNSTHPSPAQRISNINNRIPNYRITDTASARRQRFNRIMDRR